MHVDEWDVVRTENLARFRPQAPIPGVTSYVLDWSSSSDGSLRPVEAITRFQPGAAFEEPLDHPDGPSRIVVLSGRLRDENGAYDPFTRIHVPRGAVHTPYSGIGCLVHVRFLSKHSGQAAVAAPSGWDVVRPEDLKRLQPQFLAPGVTGYVLSWSSPASGPPQPTELIADFQAGSAFGRPLAHVDSVADTLVLSGRLRDENGAYDPFTRIHVPRGAIHTPYSDIGCRVHVTLPDR